jgi:hypothetical protein
VLRYGARERERRCEGCGEIQSRMLGSGRWRSVFAAASAAEDVVAVAVVVAVE